MRSNVSCPRFKGLQRLIQLRWCKKASNQNWDDKVLEINFTSNIVAMNQCQPEIQSAVLITNSGER